MLGRRLARAAGDPAERATRRSGRPGGAGDPAEQSLVLEVDAVD
ncbi:hypothetical protein F4558_003676 [Micromonospora profundi]|nr:hypothetical protein [Micromonospora profundi]NJC13850.1 hypothetical protein [Micromonospora profundi]